MAGPRRIRFEAETKDAGRRLDQVLADHVPGLSRRKARVLLDIGGVFVDSARVKVASKKIRKGQTIEAVMGGALERATSKTGTEARLKDDATLPFFSIVHIDDSLVVVEKPAGLLTAPTPESDRGNLAALLELQLAGPIFVVHRLDLDTSGLLVFARTEEANRELSKKFASHDLAREYLAIAIGRVPDALTGIDHPVNDKRAVTLLKVLRRFGDKATELRCTLETGRTHQIRIHLRVRGYPVAGDRLHGVDTPGVTPPRMALHATRLGIVHPVTGEKLEFESPWPADLAAWIGTLG